MTNQIIALVMPETKKTVKIETPEDVLTGDGLDFTWADFAVVSASFEEVRVFAMFVWLSDLNI